MRITNYDLRVTICVSLLMFAGLSLTACVQSSDCFREDVFCAGLVTDMRGIEDHGINQETWSGLQAAKAGGVVDQIAYIESLDTRDYEKNIAYFGDGGYDVIITNGVGMRDDTYRGAGNYMDTVFVGMNQPHEKMRGNIIPITFPEDQMGFLAGAAAARVSKTGMVGAVCETSGIDALWRYCEGFRAGVKFTDKDIKALVIYRENGDREKLFVDEKWGYETAQGLIKRGADVIFAAGGVTGQGAIRAAVASRIKAIGAERDQAAAVALGESNLYKTYVVTSVYPDASLQIQYELLILKNGVGGSLPPAQVKFAPLADTYPESFTRDLKDIAAKLWNGEIKTHVTTTKP